MRKFWLVALLLPAVVQAETAYVTDVLRLNVYATADFSGNPLRTLLSGDAFEVLVRDRLATQVELADGTQWVVPSMSTWNATINYRFDLWDSRTRVQLGIRNLTDERAPLADLTSCRRCFSPLYDRTAVSGDG